MLGDGEKQVQVRGRARCFKWTKRARAMGGVLGHGGPWPLGFAGATPATQNYFGGRRPFDGGPGDGRPSLVAGGPLLC
jgi:hypothetical protein